MAIALAQSPVGSAGAEPLTVQITGVTAGNLLVAAIAETTGNARNFTSLESDNGGAFTEAVTYQSSASLNRKTGIYYLPNCNAGTHNVTFNVSGTATVEVWLFEFSGCDTASPFEVGDFFENTSGTTKHHADTTEIDTTTANTAIVAICVGGGSLIVNYSPDANYTQVSETSTSLQVQYRISTGTVANERATFTHTDNRTGNAAIAAFKAAGTSTSVVPRRLALLGTG